MKIYYDGEGGGRHNLVKSKLFFPDYELDLSFNMVINVQICHKITATLAYRLADFTTMTNYVDFYSFINALDLGLLPLPDQSTLLLKRKSVEIKLQSTQKQRVYPALRRRTWR
ncbi:hypothetical protein SPM24T3_04427 [Serratia sp. M24T3]|nr:hypothetical protein SPM24T3_04427 [Serratia sp. M24T3]